MARVLLLGGHGRVGRAAAQSITRDTQHEVWLASRRERALPTGPAAAQLRNVRLDALDPSGLAAQCKDVDLVVSSVGPSGRIGARVAAVCRRAGKPYVDAGGYDPLLSELERLDREAPARAPAVISVGLLPGLSGTFPAHVLEARSRGRQVVGLTVAYAGRDAWSFNSAWDIINGVGDFGAELGFCRVEQGELVRVPWTAASREFAFPEPLGAARAFLIHSVELRRLAQQLGIGDLSVYGVNVGRRAAFVCLAAKLFRLYRHERAIDRCARWLEVASAADMRRSDPVYGMLVSAHFADGGTVQGSLVLSDTYRATGATIGVTVKHLLAHGASGTSVALLHEALPAADFMAALGAELGADLRLSVWEEAAKANATGVRPAMAQGASNP